MHRVNKDKLTPNQHIATQIHLMYCNCYHTRDISWLTNLEACTDCTWYLEEQIDTCWSLPAHTRYMDIVQELLKTLEVRNIGACPNCEVIEIKSVVTESSENIDDDDDDDSCI